MKRLLLLLALNIKLFAFESLPEDYLVTYGSPDARLNIVQYYAFTCPHCIALFRAQFQEIKKRYIDAGLVSWTFHPVPMDLSTVQAMDCLKILSSKEKRIFLEAMLEEVVIENPQITVLLMKRGMEVLGKPISSLDDKEYLAASDAFLDSFTFLKQERQLKAVPAVEANGIFIPNQIPDLEFLEGLLNEMELEE